ncbi:protein asteroid homolog 1-like [Actinia tenebrosa]|uniref:Protein asteroid homolog 1-like n=1 Tax=Actinia tenebrosa TaxID=6105 RepID=A0A6P8I8N4_ACTTE|nr:protein asteroid homolog 1-like [Actinia tenebrosa]
MGIRGLHKYAKSVKSLWTNIQLGPETRIIIDGSSLPWYLNKEIDFQRGGNYDQLAAAIAHFFNAFASNGVKTYVIIDGPTVAKDKKLKCIEMRFEEDINSSTGDGGRTLLPLMSLRGVFIQELRKLEIPFVVCDCEADQEIASLAYHWNCPVISNDSDYFIFDLRAGYIPLSSLDWKGRPITGELYKRQRLSDHLRIRPEFFPLVASLVGNDFIEKSTLAPLENTLFPGLEGSPKEVLSKKMEKIAEFFSSINDVEKALECALERIPYENQRTTLRSALEESMKEYSICDFTLNGFFESGELQTSLKTLNQENIPSLVMERYRNGVFPVIYMGVLTSGRHFLHVQVEKSNESSAHDCSRELRRIIYGIIMKPMKGQESKRKSLEVKEWSRDKRSMKIFQVQPLWEPVRGYGELLKLDNLPETEIEERRQMLLIILKANTALIKSLHNNVQLFAASVRYWISEAKPCVNPIWVQALLLVHLKLLPERQDKKSSPAKCSDSKTSDFDIDCQHSIAQWQAVMMEAIALNQILLGPLFEPRISTLYNGVTAHSIVREIEEGKKAESLAKKPDIFRQLYAAVTEQEPPEVLHGNQFAFLCDDEPEDES